MKHFWTVFFALLFVLPACGSETPDDDDDDDDDSSRDDDFGYNGITFGAELTVTPDATGLPTGLVSIDYVLHYWTDIHSGVSNCDQHIELSGTVMYGAGSAPGCSNCTGFISLDPSSAVDVSNPAAGPEHCDPAVLEYYNLDFGMLMVQPTGPKTYGDFLQMGIMAAETQAALGLDWSLDSEDDLTADGIEAELDELGFAFVQAGLVEVEGSTLGEATGLASVAESESPGSPWYGYWKIFKNPALNSHEGIDLIGDYRAQAFWEVIFVEP